jgi:hypothetical protein
MSCLAVVTACDEDDPTGPDTPPLASVRFINAVADTGAVDIRAIDQVQWSPVANALAFRTGTEHQPAEAKIRRFRVFPTSTNPAVASQIIHDAEVTLTAGSRVTLLLAGSARAGTVRLWVIDDATTPPPAGQIGVRMVNAGAGVADAYVVTAATDPLPTSPNFTNVGAITGSPYATRATGNAALRVTDAGQRTATASAAGPAAPAPLAGAKPAAGVNAEGTMFSVYYFSAGAAGSANSTLTAPGLVWFVDRNPCDDPPAAGCTP